MRLIDADALYKSFGASGNCSNCPLDWYKCQYYNEHTLMEFCERIDDAPTVDAEPVKRGRWLDGTCSECGKHAVNRVMFRGEVVWEDSYDYCPHCGARMDGERKEDGRD